MTRVYYKGAAACVIMFDLTSQQTFNSTIKWKRDLDSKCTLPNGKTIPCILVGNKVSYKLINTISLGNRSHFAMHLFSNVVRTKSGTQGTSDCLTS